MEKLIAFVDGSIYSQSVCDHAAWVAGRTGAAVEVHHVLGRREGGPDRANLSGNITLGARTALLAELTDLDAQRAKLSQKIGRAILDDAKARLEEDGIQNVSVRLRFGDIIDTVAETEAGAGLIVIGKRGEAADFAKLHLGSNLERVVRTSRKPVMVAARAFKPINKFMIAFDGGTSCMKAVDHVARSPLFAGLSCRLLMGGTESAANVKALDDARAMLEAGSYIVEANIVPGQPDTVISEAVEREGVDLLVMGAYGHSRIRSLIIGSTTTEMVRSCKIPVILYR
ncbi:MAG: universal stress protein [Proteobacteria bacterium]|nr:universal stress protein [Pseudomonadota bacterium]